MCGLSHIATARADTKAVKLEILWVDCPEGRATQASYDQKRNEQQRLKWWLEVEHDWRSNVRRVPRVLGPGAIFISKHFFFFIKDKKGLFLMPLSLDLLRGVPLRNFLIKELLTERERKGWPVLRVATTSSTRCHLSHLWKPSVHPRAGRAVFLVLPQGCDILPPPFPCVWAFNNTHSKSRPKTSPTLPLALSLPATPKDNLYFLHCANFFLSKHCLRYASWLVRIYPYGIRDFSHSIYQ